MLTILLQNPTSTLSFVLVATLFIERLVAGGYLRLMIGRKMASDIGNQGSKDKTTMDVLYDVIERMGVLETHFNHETTVQYEAVIKGQEKILDTLIRIERDGIRIKQ